MWPHHIVVGIDATAVSVASDDAGVIAQLEPWRVDIDAPLVDFALELEPPRSEAHQGLRLMPQLKHGTCDLIRLRDADELTTALMRVLASFRTSEQPDRVRVGLMPIVHDGRAILLSADHGGRISRRWYSSQSVTPYYGVSTLINLVDQTIEIDMPLGVDEPAATTRRSFPLLDWWIPTADRSVPLSAGHAVAHAMALTQRVVGRNGAETLHAMARLVESRPPSLAPVAMDHVIEQIDPRGAAAVRDEVMTQIVDTFSAA